MYVLYACMHYPPWCGVQENALLLSRLGRHRAVLEVYVHLLQDLSAAEDYCQRTYAANLTPQPAADADREAADIYLTLLQVGWIPCVHTYIHTSVTF